MKKLKKVLNKEEDNHLFPFFWIHGEDEKTLREYVNKVNDLGIKSICVESRPHPDFIGNQWWEDLEIIIDETKKNNMKIWILDDKQFPTGYAAGKIESDYPHLQKMFLKMDYKDVVGPKNKANILVKWALLDGRMGLVNPEPEKKTSKTSIEPKIIKVLAAKKTGYEKIEETSFVDITNNLKDGVVTWDIPEGEWSIFTFVQTTEGGEEATRGYLNPLIPEATDVLINTVYEAHYEKFKDEFGKTITGFFSDEPRFGNIKGPNASIGREKMPLPWREDLLVMLEEEYDIDFSEYLPLLFFGESNKANELRYLYMDYISKLYAENFTNRIGKWCEKHQVSYTGHLIEDNNAHSRLGYGAGHFFRGMKGQNIAGIDIVLHQLMPGYDKGYFKSMTSTGWDGEFFHYGLAKLGSSLGHLDENKMGRVMCEVFGAYGWNEGLRLMKWITDHMLVRGVNYFVPHAFSLNEFPDPDCPPHFYAHGENPQYRYTDQLVSYMNRMSTLLSGGKHIATAGILYHAEAEWSGDYMLFQKPARELTQNQIDFDVIPIDYLEKAEIENKKYKIGEELFSVLIIPYSEALPMTLLKKIKTFMENKIPVIFIDDLPSRSSENVNIEILLKSFSNNKYCNVSKLNKLSDLLKDNDLNEINVSTKEEYLRYYHYKQDDGDIFFFTNEDPAKKLTTKVTLPVIGSVYSYDPFSNRLTHLQTNNKDKYIEVKLNLEAFSSEVIIITPSKILNVKTNESFEEIKTQSIYREMDVSFSRSKEYPNFKNKIEISNTDSTTLNDSYSGFSGTIKYELQFENEEKKSDRTLLKINEVFEAVEVTLNNKKVGVRISEPYEFDISSQITEGKNNLTIEVTNTLGNEEKDYLSQYLVGDPVGINGDILVKYYKK